MRKFIFAMTTLAVFGFFASEASAVTVLNTTQADVKKQCEAKCSGACGSTICSYVCDNPKKQCTVSIYLKRPPGWFPGSTDGSGMTRSSLPVTAAYDPPSQSRRPQKRGFRAAPLAKSC